MEKIRSMVDVNAVVGAPITTPDGATLIPVSRLSFGFASGGGDKTASTAKPGIWGGGGALHGGPVPGHGAGAAGAAGALSGEKREELLRTGLIPVRSGNNKHC